MQTSMHHNDCTLSVKRKDDLVARTTNGQIVGPGPLDSAAGFWGTGQADRKAAGLHQDRVRSKPRLTTKITEIS